MANWLLNVSEKWLQSVYDVLHEQLCKEPVLHADETTLQVLKEPGRSSTSKSYMWLYRTSGCAKQAIVLYEYQPTRKAEHAEAFLKGFSGWLHADGYQRGIISCRGTSVWWAVGHMRGENLTRHWAPCRKRNGRILPRPWANAIARSFSSWSRHWQS